MLKPDKQFCEDEFCPYLLDDGNCSFIECVLELEQSASKTRKKRKKDKERVSDFD